jgi:Ca2+/H+ antiporter
MNKSVVINPPIFSKDIAMNKRIVAVLLSFFLLISTICLLLYLWAEYSYFPARKAEIMATRTAEAAAPSPALTPAISTNIQEQSRERPDISIIISIVLFLLTTVLVILLAQIHMMKMELSWLHNFITTQINFSHRDR